MSGLLRVWLLLGLPLLVWAGRPIESKDVYRIQEVVEVELSPDGAWVAYVVQKNDRPLGTYDQIWVMSTKDRTARRISPTDASESAIRWKPDSSAFAFFSNAGGKPGIWVAQPGGKRQFLVAAENTNHVLPTTGKRMDWSPDGKQLAYVAADPKDPRESTDPVHITRYLYKFISGEDDNRHIHIHLLDLATRRSRKLTDGPYYEHSIEWSPDGKEILFESNRGPLDELEFNYDILAVDVSTGKERQLTHTKSQEYQATFSPDGKKIAYLGTKRDITCSETTMEDTHVWTIGAEGGTGRELPGTLQLDRRCQRARWAPDGRSIYFLGQDHGDVHLYRVPAEGDGPVKQVTDWKGTLTDYSVSKNGKTAYAYRSPKSPAELFLDGQQVTQLNQVFLNEVDISLPEEVNYQSVDGTPVQAWITPALHAEAGKKYPFVLQIHGGPHGQQGAAFNIKAQVYAARGISSMMVNYRGSTGYGEKFSEGTFQNNDGTEWEDVNAGVDYAIAHKPYVDPDKLGIEGTSYGGQLTNWGITRTTRFKAAIPTAGISNFISYNFNSYYHDYYRVEYNSYPWEGDNYKILWEHSPLAYVTRVKTPVLFIHGALDNDVPVNDSEQYFIALLENHVPTEMLRYPREGHGLREPGHVVDAMERSLAWYARWMK
ncbi:MAG TPA: S9 family peptidase [Bryobacteraceae bacterium]|nr:S9 family peptidase [Bryobacteraceae bacterium]